MRRERLHRHGLIDVRVRVGVLLAALLCTRLVHADEPPRWDQATLSSGAPQPLARVVDSGVHAAGTVWVAVGAGYARSTDVIAPGDSHQRASGLVTVEARPLSWLSLGLRLDGRYDRYATVNTPVDYALTGEPRLQAQVDRVLGARLSLGARVSAWIPGDQAPSLQPSATTTDALLLGTYAITPALTVTGNLGYRLDYSTRSVSQADLLKPGDRLALDVSQYDAALLGVALVQRGPNWRAQVQWSAQPFIGSDAPGWSNAPMQVGVGFRRRIRSSMAIDVEAEWAPTSRVAQTPERLVPAQPRAGIKVGLLVALGSPTKVGLRPPAESARPRVAATVAPPLPPPPPKPEPRATLRGHVVITPQGRPTSVTVTLLVGDDPGRPIALDQDNRFLVEDLPVSVVALVIDGRDCEPLRTSVDLAQAHDEQTFTVERKVRPGEIRGFVRGWNGQPVNAEIQVSGLDGVPVEGGKTRAIDGRFRITLAPGDYFLSIEAPGFSGQRRRLQVQANSVTVLNADLRRKSQ